MGQKKVPDFNSAVLTYLKLIAEGGITLDSCQLQELPPDLSAQVAQQAEAVTDAATMTRLTGRTVEPDPSKVDVSRLLQYFSSSHVDAESQLLDDRLDHPISNYFINTSHNTYLTGNQLYGSASTEAYKDVLRRGCRSIEIDVWDGRNGLEDRSSKHAAAAPEPRVLHGHTLTKEVPFRDVCVAIKEAAFENSDLPVIVSLEVHAHSQQQEKMVEIMQAVWHDRLVPSIGDDCRALPSPTELRGKILVKVKGAPLPGSIQSASALQKTQTNDTVSEPVEEESSEDELQLDDGPTLTSTQQIDKKKKRSTSKIISSLSALGVYTLGYRFKGFSSPEANLPHHVFSLSEGKVLSVHESDGHSLFRHNRYFMMRAFPSGSRVNSSNLDPPVFWRRGIQMVALNWQKTDASIMLNRAMFADSHGWVLKPKGYLGTASPQSAMESTQPSALSTQEADSVERVLLNLAVEILAAQSLPPAKRPYVKCELHVETLQERKGEKIEGDGRSKEGEHKRRTKVSKTLDFHQELLEFANIPDITPALSFVRFKVMDDVLGPDELVAWSCIRLDRLQAGVRFLHLLDARGHDIDGVLLLNVQISMV